jgi:nucleoside-diphosphate-sugar epimerase
MKIRVVLAGGSGFLGRALAAALVERGYPGLAVYSGFATVYFAAGFGK